MFQTAVQVDTGRYSQCIEASKRIRWDIDKDVIRGGHFDFSRKFLPDSLSKVHQLDFLSADEQRLISQIQGRTYANMFGLVERFINAKILEVSRDHWLSDQTALEALMRFSEEELKHQELFRRVDRLIADGMPPGYSFVPQPNDVASVVLSKSTPSPVTSSYLRRHIINKVLSRMIMRLLSTKTYFSTTGRRNLSMRFWMSLNGA